MMTEKNRVVIVGASQQYSAAHDSLTLDTLSEGDFLWVDQEGATIATADLSSATLAQLVYGTKPFKGKRNYFALTPLMEPSQVLSYTKTDYSAPASEVWHLGYNGTDGDLPVANDTLYGIVISDVIKRSVFHNSDPSQFLYTRSSATAATKQDVVYDLVKKAAGLRNYDQSLGHVKVEMVADITAAGSTIAAGTIAVTQGSKELTGTGSFTNVSAGNFIILDGVVYKVAASANNNSATLDIPYIGSTGTVANADADVVASFTSVGIKVTAIQPQFDIHSEYTRKRLHVGASHGWAGDVESRRTVADDPGVGCYEQVAIDEYRAKGNANQTNFTEFPVLDVISSASSGTNYDCHDILIKQSGPYQGVSQLDYHKNFTLWIPVSGAGTHISDLLATQFGNLMP